MRTLLILVLSLLLLPARAQHPRELLLKDASLQQPPKFTIAPDIKPADPVVQAILYEAKPFQGKPTRTFAYMAVPKAAPGQKVPAMVLIHGGGGTAFDRWVKLWYDRGYAAIAMDTCGALPVRDEKNKGWKRNPEGGPAGWNASFDQMNQPVTDQWQYHALADIVLAHSLLRAQEGVDPDRIGATGISWGGYLTCLVAGLDSRFKFAVPVYGCGFIDRCTWQPILQKMPPEKSKLWLEQWDPKHWLGHAAMPMLWVTGTNDFAYPFDALQASYRLPKTERTLCITLRMPHGHGAAGENPQVIHDYANAMLKSGTRLPAITGQGREKNTAWATFTSPTAVKSAQILYTLDSGAWQKRNWQTAPAAIGDDYKIKATIPNGAKAWYLNLTDERGLVISSEHDEQP